MGILRQAWKTSNAFGSKNNPKSFVSEEDKKKYIRIHDFLRSIAEREISSYQKSQDLELKPMNFSPLYGSRGHRPVDMWMSICGSGSTPFGKMPQIYIIASNRGIEIGFAVSIDEADYHDPNAKARNRQVVPRINSKLPSVGSDLSSHFERTFEADKRWHFNRKARLLEGDKGWAEWASFSHFISYLKANGTATGGGSIALTIPIQAVSEEAVGKEFSAAVDLFLPLLEACQPEAIEHRISEAEKDLEKISQEAGFDPTSIVDGREKILREISSRRGQASFRSKLLVAYKFRCAISETEVPSVLEAAHIVPYQGEQTNHISNGLLIRSDLHTLFDLGLLRINPETLEVSLAGELLDTPYKAYQGRKLRLPDAASQRPSAQALGLHFNGP